MTSELRAVVNVATPPLSPLKAIVLLDTSPVKLKFVALDNLTAVPVTEPLKAPVNSPIKTVVRSGFPTVLA